MLYNLIFDSDQYLAPVFDDDQIREIIGEISDETIDKRIDMNGAPRSYKGIINEPLRLTFPCFNKGDRKKAIPDISVFEGRLFLKPNAYDVLQPLIKDDGEFLPAAFEEGNGYIFTPLRVVEDVDGLDMEHTFRNQSGDVEHLAIYKDKVKEWAVFRAKYNAYMSLYCQQHVKDAIEEAGLTGLYITTDLANIFPEERSAVTKIN